MENVCDREDWIKYLYNNEIYPLLVLFAMYLNVGFVLDGDVMLGVLLSIMHCGWIFNIIYHKCWERWTSYKYIMGVAE